jgi:hypothetical protein
VICAALAEGRQTLILRKGGIHEGHGGFQVEHREFWLFPTYVHQDEAGVIGDARPLLDRARRERPPDDVVRISHYAVVEQAIEIREPAVAVNLAGHHIWSAHTVEMRFHYRRPGLYVLAVRVYRVPQQFELPNSEYFAGCRSWVELPMDLPTAGLQPVLDDEEAARRSAAIRDAVAPKRIA